METERSKPGVWWWVVVIAAVVIGSAFGKTIAALVMGAFR